MNPLLKNEQFINFADLTDADIKEMCDYVIKQIEAVKLKLKSSINTIDDTTFIMELAEVNSLADESQDVFRVYHNQFFDTPFYGDLKSADNTIINSIDDLLQDQELHKHLIKIQASKTFDILSGHVKRIYFTLCSYFNNFFDDTSLNLKIENETIEINHHFNNFSKSFKYTNKNVCLNLRDNTNLNGVSQETIDKIRTQAQQNKMTGYFSAYFSDLNEIIVYADEPDVRKNAYEFLTSLYGNQPLTPVNVFDDLKNVVTHRHDLAKLQGYANVVDKKAKDLDLKSAKNIKNFLRDILKSNQKKLKKEIAEIQAFARSNGYMQPLQAWDYEYYIQKMIHTNFPLSSSIYDYCDLDSVLKGIFALIKRLYDVTIKEIQITKSWHNDVRRFAVNDAQNKTLGYIELDPAERSNKKTHTFASVYRNRSMQKNNNELLPIVYLNFTYTKNDQNQITSMGINAIKGLLHEFGHALHHVFIQENKPLLSCMSDTQLDWLEFHSQLLEQFVLDSEFLKSCSRRSTTNQDISDSILEQAINAYKFYYYIDLIRNIVYSYVDNYIYTQSIKRSFADSMKEIKKDLDLDITLCENSIYSNIEDLVVGKYHGCRYVYLYSEIRAIDAFNRIQSAQNPSLICQEMVAKVLAPGIGIGFTAECYKKYINGEVSMMPFLDHYNIIVNPLLENKQFIRFSDITEDDIKEMSDSVIKQIEAVKVKLKGSIKTIDDRTFIMELAQVYSLADENLDIIRVFHNQSFDSPIYAALKTAENQILNAQDDLLQEEDLHKHLSEIQASNTFDTLADKIKRIYFRLCSYFNHYSVNNSLNSQIDVKTTQINQHFNKFTNSFKNAKKLSLDLSAKTNLGGVSTETLNRLLTQAQKKQLTGHISAYYSDVLEIIEYADDTNVRKKAYEFFINLYGQQTLTGENVLEDFKKVVVNRQELAKLQGFNSVVDKKADDLTLKTAENIEKFLLDLLKSTQKKFKKDIADVQDYARYCGYHQTLQAWDYKYYIQKMIDDKFIFSRYFPAYCDLDSVLKGIFDLIKSLYGVTIEVIEISNSWYKDVKRFAVKNAENKILGYIELDPAERSNKKFNTFSSTYRNRSIQKTNKEILPIVYLNSSFIKNEQNKITNLNLMCIRSLLRQFGDALHHVFIQETLPQLTCMSDTQLDWLSFHSRFLEQFVCDSAFLKSCCRAPIREIPDSIVEHAINAFKLNNCFDLIKNIVYAYVDNYIYTHSITTSFADCMKEIKNKLGSEFEFSEINIYSSIKNLIEGKYYGCDYVYLYAEINALDAFNRIQTAISKKQKCQEMVAKVLAPGIGIGFTAECYKKFIIDEVSMAPFFKKYGIKQDTPSQQNPNQPAAQVVSIVPQPAITYHGYQNFCSVQMPAVWTIQKRFVNSTPVVYQQVFPQYRKF